MILSTLCLAHRSSRLFERERTRVYDREYFNVDGDAPPVMSRVFGPQRSDLNPARSSSEKIVGCSKAAKCPPLGSLL